MDDDLDIENEDGCDCCAAEGVAYCDGLWLCAACLDLALHQWGATA